MSSPKIVMVVGASRGIGRNLVDQFAKLDYDVIGTVRKSSDGDFGHKNARSIILDLDKAASIEKAASVIKEIDILMVNAGMGLAEPILGLSEAEFQNYLNINVTGPWRVVKAFIPALKARETRKIVFTSSISGSMQLNFEEKASVRGAYAVTKAAINMLALQLHQDLNKSDNFVVVPMHPGWVDTALGNPGSAYQGAMPPSESAKGIRDVVVKLGHGDSGKFFQWDGENLPW